MLDAKREIETANRRIGEIGQDIARLEATTGDAFTMTVLGQNHTERKEAGRALRKEILTLVQLNHEGEVHIATIGGFDLIYEGERFGRGTITTTRPCSSAQARTTRSIWRLR